jgi:hypothetical protein
VQEGPPSAEAIKLNLSTPDLIVEGIRRIDAWSRISRAIGGKDARYERAADFEAALAVMSLGPSARDRADAGGAAHWWARSAPLRRSPTSRSAGPSGPSASSASCAARTPPSARGAGGGFPRRRRPRRRAQRGGLTRARERAAPARSARARTRRASRSAAG